jgi:hypothetical protein
VDLGAAVQPHERVLPVRHVLLQQIDHSRKECYDRKF